MRPPFPLMLIAVLFAILGGWLGGDGLWLHYIGKPAATLSMLWLALSARPAVGNRYRYAVAAGMVFSLIGDICLMLPWDLFVPGLLAFLLAHVCYIVAFAPGSSIKARVAMSALVAAIAAANLWALLPRVDAALQLPVVAYTGVLAAMAAFALARALTPSLAQAAPRSARVAAIGAVFFMLSDSLLAWDKFGGGIPLSAWLVLGTYYAAQWCIARSVERG